MACFGASRAVRLEEQDSARRDRRLKARFLSFRLNRPTVDLKRKSVICFAIANTSHPG